MVEGGTIKNNTSACFHVHFSGARIRNVTQKHHEYACFICIIAIAAEVCNLRPRAESRDALGAAYFMAAFAAASAAAAAAVAAAGANFRRCFISL